MLPQPAKKKSNSYGPTSFTCQFNALDCRSVKATYELLRAYCALLEESLAKMQPVGRDTGPASRRPRSVRSAVRRSRSAACAPGGVGNA